MQFTISRTGTKEDVVEFLGFGKDTTDNTQAAVAHILASDIRVNAEDGCSVSVTVAVTVTYTKKTS